MLKEKDQATTSWVRVFLLFGAGASAAGLVGKVPVALPALRDDLSLSLFAAGLVISIFSLIAALFGAGFGAIADRFGPSRIAIIGLLLAVFASIGGALVNSSELLIVTRILEGIGFFLASTAIPALMLALSHPADRQKAMGLWGAFLPAGTAIMMIAGGSMIELIGWRGLWVGIAIVLLFAAIAVHLATRSLSSAPAMENRFSLLATYRILLDPGPLLMALVFIAYSAQFLAVTAFIPLILVEESNWSIPAAGLAGGMVIGANVIGNIASGVLLDAGLRRQFILVVGATGMALGAITLLGTDLPEVWRLAGGALFTIAGGLIPGALFAGTTLHAPRGTEISTLNGLLLQGAAIGQLAGPPIAVAFAERAGDWSGVLWFTIPSAVVAIILALLLGNIENRMQVDLPRA